MNTGWFEELKALVEEFVDKATDEELQAALQRSNYDLYKDVNVTIIDVGEVSCVVDDVYLVDRSELSVADDYAYAIAA